MKRTAWSLACLFVFLFGAWCFIVELRGNGERAPVPLAQDNAIDGASSQVAQSEHVAPANRKAAPVVSAPQHFTALPVSHPSALPRKPGGPPPKLEGNVVEYQVIDGLAVAYGDILLGKPDGPVPGGVGRHEVQPVQFWDRPEIPYAINPELPQPERVEKALTYLRQKTPVNFVHYTGQKDAIVFETGNDNCLSPLGRIGGTQPIKLAAGCQSQEILHEILHSLGFVHEQSRKDRDRSIEILWDNIEEKRIDQFTFVPDALLEAVRGFPFDYRSIMLYRTDAFAAHPGQPTMRSLTADPISPVAEGLSEGDIKRMNRMFRGYE
jgi:hypothetical protein